nr:hypothetical protein [Tanacetum cinerariifolium]
LKTQYNSPSDSIPEVSVEVPKSEKGGSKKKRKKGRDGSGTSPGEGGTVNKSGDRDKRTKTGRACDACVSSVGIT